MPILVCVHTVKCPAFLTKIYTTRLAIFAWSQKGSLADGALNLSVFFSKMWSSQQCKAT